MGRTTQLCRMATTLRMRTTISPENGGSQGPRPEPPIHLVSGKMTFKKTG